MNAPDPNDHIILLPGEVKLSFVSDTHLSDSGTFIILKEDHTVGNPIRCSLLRDPSVLFAGYRLPHPLENKMLIKVRTTTDSTPQAALQHATQTLIDEHKSIKQQFKQQADQLKNDREDEMYMHA